nr:hypothetical protein [Tanacetum cinerariifolium]
SENYATSAWCLDELSLILEQRWECNRFVLPIFYHVNPSDIRKRSEIPMIEVDAYPRWAYYKMTHWKNALKEVADLAGMNNLLSEESCAKVLAIYGMRGSAKIKLANHIDASNYKQFKYMKNPGEISIDNESKYSLRLKEYLLQHIQINKKGKIMTVSQGKWPEFVNWRQEYQKMLMGDDKDLEHLKQQVSRYYAEIKGGRLIIIGDVDPVRVATCVRKIEMAGPIPV